jgi:hypothetical protein
VNAICNVSPEARPIRFFILKSVLSPVCTPEDQVTPRRGPAARAAPPAGV